jgi:two-component system alkaline phosphatase synthesis response regulator PhoP
MPKKILIVDDDPDFVESNKQLLEANGYQVVSASNGGEGLALAKKEKPDLMILDVMMATNTEGFEVSRKIPETPELRNMPVLLVTGIRRALHLPFGFEPDKTWLPVDSVFEKPIDPAVLLQEIKKRIG